jgi:hypothetical protein
MADPKQFTTGSLSQGGASRTAAPVGTSHGEPNVSRVVEEAKEVGNELIGAVREGATSFLEEQRNRAASEIASVGEMLRQSARGLDQNRATAISRYTEKAADEITQFADRLRRRPLGMMAEDVEDFARRWPVGFMAAAAGAGFLVGRFLIASGSRSQSQTMDRSSSRPTSSMADPVGGARRDLGAVGGAASGGNAGYGASGMQERH